MANGRILKRRCYINIITLVVITLLYSKISHLKQRCILAEVRLHHHNKMAYPTGYDYRVSRKSCIRKMYINHEYVGINQSKCKKFLEIV